MFDPTGPGTGWLGGGQGASVPRRDRPARQGVRVPDEADRLPARRPRVTGPPRSTSSRQELRARGKRVDMMVGAETMDHVFKPIEGKRLSQTIAIVTRGRRASASRVASSTRSRRCSSPPARRSSTRRRRARRCGAIAELCAERQIPSQMAVEEHMALRHRHVLHVHRPGHPQGRLGVRQPARVHRRAGVQPGADPVGPVDGRRAAHDRRPRPRASRWCGRGRDERRRCTVDLGGDLALPAPGARGVGVPRDRPRRPRARRPAPARRRRDAQPHDRAVQGRADAAGGGDPVRAAHVRRAAEPGRRGVRRRGPAEARSSRRCR